MGGLLIALAAAGGYLFGSIPFGLVLTRLAGLGDIRAIGSGNIGATNVLRTGRKDLAALTLILDAGKAGIAAAVFGYFLGTTAGLVAGAFAFAGHCFPVWLGFKGGKGVATFVGTMLVVFWPVGVTVIATWLVMAAIFRISSLAALAAALAAPFAAFAWGRLDVAIMAGGLTVLIYWLHRANIQRLFKGEEPRIGGKKAKAETPTEDPDTPAT
ncbi:MAG: glycerol-3-phosphate 1-O-acyltransferase PlsY [Maricaulis maris]